MGQSESFDLLNSSNVNSKSKSKKEANSIYNFDLNGIFRRIGDIETIVSMNDPSASKIMLRQADKSTNSTVDHDEIELISESKETSSYHEDEPEAIVYNERLIDGPETEIEIELSAQETESHHQEQTKEFKAKELVNTELNMSELQQDNTVESLNESDEQEIKSSDNQLAIENLNQDSSEKYEQEEEIKNVKELSETEKP